MPQKKKSLDEDFIPLEQDFIPDEAPVPEDSSSFLSRAWNSATTNIPSITSFADSVANYLDPQTGDTSKSYHPSAAFGAGVIRGLIPDTPLDIGLSALPPIFGGTRRAIKGARNVSRAARATSEVVPAIKPSGIEKVGQAIAKPSTEDILISQGYNPAAIKIKPKSVDPNLNQGIGDPELAGSVPYKAAGPLTTADRAVAQELPKPVSRLPQELRGAKPRFNIGTNSYSPQFESDIDKAAFIIAQKNPSKRDADYLAYIMNATGMDELAARTYGSEVRGIIKNALKGQEPGNVNIKDVWSTYPNKPVSTVTDKANKVKEILRTNPNKTLKEAQDEVKAMAGGTPPIKPPSVISKLDEDFIPDTPKAELPVADVRRSAKTEAWNFGRGVMTAYDLSAPGRQGLPLIHKKAWWTSWGDMVKSLGSEDAFRAVMDGIERDPLLLKRTGRKVNGRLDERSIIEEAGLALTDLTSLSRREEAIMSTLAEKLPGVRASNRAYTAYLNKLRLDTFKSMVKDADKLGVNTPQAMQTYAKFINDATGRGSLGRFEKNAVELNNVFFSPRMISARVNMFRRGLTPSTYLNADPVLRKETIKSLLSIVGFGGVLGQLARTGGAEVSGNPTNSDFGKIQIGNTRIDPYAGFQQYAVAATRLLTSTSTNTNNEVSDLLNPEYGGDTHGTVAARFGANKLHPLVKFAWDIANPLKEKYAGWEKVSSTFTSMDPSKNRLMELFVPMIIGDLIEVAQEDPSLLPIALPASATGMGVSTFQ